MTNTNDIMLDGDDDLLITGGDLTLGASFVQEVGIITRLNKGELKADPLLGPELIRMINSKANAQDIQTALKVALERDNKNYEDVQRILKTNINE